MGRIPLNALAAAGIVILGFGEPAVWLLGLGAEVAIISSLAFNRRFQKWVDAQQLQTSKDDANAQYSGLIALLPVDSRNRLAQLQAKCQKVLQVYRNLQADEFISETNSEALQKLQWIYLKLLVARLHLTDRTADPQTTLEQKIQELEQDLGDGGDSPSVRESKAATLNIMKKRMANLRRREEALEEIDSDLMRVEAQVDLVLENATIQGKPQTISTDIELASDLVGGALFGEEEGVVADFDRKYSQRPAKDKEVER